MADLLDLASVCVIDDYYPKNVDCHLDFTILPLKNSLNFHYAYYYLWKPIQLKLKIKIRRYLIRAVRKTCKNPTIFDKKVPKTNWKSRASVKSRPDLHSTCPKVPYYNYFQRYGWICLFCIFFHSWVGCPSSRGDNCCRINRPWICSHDSMQEIYMSCENGRLLQSKNFWQKNLTSLLTKIKLLGIVFEFDTLGYQQNSLSFWTTLTRSTKLPVWSSDNTLLHMFIIIIGPSVIFCH